MIIVLLAGCSTYRGVAEFAVYRDAYDAAATTGEDILDRLAVAERNLFASAFPFDPLRTNFDPATATYFVDATDPPATAAFRRTLRATKLYNDALHGLASGDAAAAIAGKITRLSAIGAGAAADLAALSAAGPTSGAVAAVATATTVNTTLAGLEPLTAEVIGFATREAFRQRLLEQEPIIRAAIDEVRSSTPKIFGALRDNVISAASSDPSRTGLTGADREEIRRLHSLMANWVVLLNASLASLEVAVTAVRSDGSAGGFDGLLLTSEELAGAVRAARVNLAGGD